MLKEHMKIFQMTSFLSTQFCSITINLPQDWERTKGMKVINIFNQWAY